MELIKPIDDGDGHAMSDMDSVVKVQKLYRVETCKGFVRETPEGPPAEYIRGEARKKARAFDGSITATRNCLITVTLSFRVEV
jgi:hypothetical protein